MPSLVNIVGVSKKLGDKNIIQDMSFSIQEGEILGVIGPSGAGKTTLFKTLVGYYEPDKGKIVTDSSGPIPASERNHLIGFATQDGCFYDTLTVEENLNYFGKHYGLTQSEIKGQTILLLDLVGLKGKEKVLAGKLSGGMRKRLDLAIALIHKPRLLILDEPTTGLDPVLRRQVWAMIEKLKSTGTTMIFSSHLLDEIEQVSDRVLVIVNGKLAAIDTPSNLAHQFSVKLEISLESYPGKYENIVSTLKAYELQFTQIIHQGKLHLYVSDVDTMLKYLLPTLTHLNERVIDLDVNKPTLSEVLENFERNNESK